MPSPRALRDAWRHHYATQREPWRGPVHAAPLLEGLSGRVVELGGGGGKVARALPHGTLALDWAPEGLDPARPCLVADVAALPLRDASVDALVAVHVLGHLLQARRGEAAREWARALRPGGVLVVEVFATGDAREGAGEPLEPGTWARAGVPTHHFSADELRALFAAPSWSGAVEETSRAFRWGTRRMLRGRFLRA